MKLTQRELVYQYILLHGSFTPAKERHATMHGRLLGDSADRRCRELRSEGRVQSEGEGRFERFYIPNFQSVTRDYKTDTAERKPMPTTPQTEAKWQQMGAYLKGKVKTNPVTPEYKDLTVEELKARKEKAEAWLQENQGHKNYSEALTRYERICDYLNLKENFL
jgi:hypothetical protein